MYSYVLCRSIHVTDTQAGVDLDSGKAASKIIALEWHTLSVDEVCTRLGVSDKLGLGQDMAARRLQRDGKNVIKPPPTNWSKKIFVAFLGGFAPLLLAASIICFVAWYVLESRTTLSF